MTTTNTTSTPTTTTTTTTTTRPFTSTPPPPRPLTPHTYYPPPPPPPPMRPQQPPQSQGGILYPVASSGRGFIPKTTLNRPQQQQQQQQQQPDQSVTVANNNPTGYPPRPAYSSHRPPIGSPLHHHHHHLDSVNNNNHSPLHMIRASHPQHPPHQFLHHPHLGPTGAVGPGPIKGIPVTVHPKVAPSPSSVADSNGYKNLRDRSRDDNLFIVRDRKVRISDGVSLYALCRSWLRNGFPEESQPQYGDGIKSLPRPGPRPWPTKKEVYGAEEDEEEEDEKSVQHLSAHDLLNGHIKRAKRVRARLREVRLKRIARYKSRLALLLPPLAEQFRNNSAAGI